MTSTSPARAYSKAFSSSGRRSRRLETFSMNSFVQPASVSASCWLSGFWSRVEGATALSAEASPGPGRTVLRADGRHQVAYRQDQARCPLSLPHRSQGVAYQPRMHTVSTGPVPPVLPPDISGGPKQTKDAILMRERNGTTPATVGELRHATLGSAVTALVAAAATLVATKGDLAATGVVAFITSATAAIFAIVAAIKNG